MDLQKQREQKIIKAQNDILKGIKPDENALKEELENRKKEPVLDKNLMPFAYGVEIGSQKIAIQALSIIKQLQSQPKGNYFLRTQIKNLQEQNRQLTQDLPRALGLLEGVVMFKDMEEFNKEGAVKIIQEVIEILKSKVGV